MSDLAPRAGLLNRSGRGGHRPGRLVWITGLLSACLLSLSSLAGDAEAKVTQEYDLKAVFLLNFARFVDWPADAFASPGAPIIIGVLGADPFGSTLLDAVSNESAHDRKVVVRYCHTAEELQACHIAFIPQAESSTWKDVGGKLAHRSVLTVGESRDFTARSGMIGFEFRGRRMRLRINLAAATAARLTISSMLLRQAEIVGSEGVTP